MSALKEPLGEFDLIERFFKIPFALKRDDLLVGIGDDCALLSLTPGHHLAVSSDVLVQGTHFFPDVDPFKLGHKSLAVNLSDLAACGARPKAFTLALTLPAMEPSWLEAFSRGLWALAQQHGCALVGGDTTRGPLSMGITIFGEVPQGQMIKRSGAQVGDDVYVSGTLGDARWALMALKGQLTMNAQHLSFARERLEMPTPRVALGLALRGLASAAMDLSDGFLGDIKHLLKRSQKGAKLDAQRMLESDLISPALRTLGQREALMMALQGGDDYELLFTASKDKRADIEALARDLALPLTAIGEVTENEGLAWVNTQALGGTEDFADLSSYDHFL